MIGRESDNHNNVDDNDDDDDDGDDDDGDDGYDNVDGRSTKLRLTFKVKNAHYWPYHSAAIPSSELPRQGVVQWKICFLKEVLKREWRGYILAVVPLYLWLHVL